MVNKSSSPCVGCAWRPSPALMTCSCGLTCRAIRNGAPEAPWRTTKMSACMADRFATALSWGLRCIFGLEGQRELAAVGALESQPLAGGHFHFRAAMLGADRQLPAAAIGEHHQRDARGPAVIEQLVHRGAHRTPGIQDVIHEQQLAAVDVERDLGALGVMLQSPGGIVVAIERNVHQPKG